MSDVVPPEHRVLGLDGPAVVVPGSVAAWLCDNAGLNAMRVRVLGRDAEVDATLMAIRMAAVTWKAMKKKEHDARVAEQQRNSTEEPPDLKSKVMSTTAIADALYVSDRCVRLWITSGQLRARRRGRHWVIDRADFDEFRATRVAA